MPRDHLTMPEISIVMPLFNKGEEVVRAINSVLAQSRHDFELIIINDGSTDNGPDLVKNIQDQRIRIIDQENRGVSAARNRGVNEARTGLIAFLDADDEWYPDFLETIFSLKDRFPECSVFATNYIYREQGGSKRYPVINGLTAEPWQGVLENYFRIAAFSDPLLWSSAVSARKNALLSVGCFPVGINSGEDLLTWARLAVKYRIAYDTTPHAVFWLPSSVLSRPTRFKKNTEDIVGRELDVLLKIVCLSRKDDLLQYIAHWHTMRASTFIELGWNREALDEIKKTIIISGYSPKVKILQFIASLPVIFSKKIYILARKIKKFCYN